jgi:hypothetical protein
MATLERRRFAWAARAAMTLCAGFAGACGGESVTAGDIDAGTSGDSGGGVDGTAGNDSGNIGTDGGSSGSDASDATPPSDGGGSSDGGVQCGNAVCALPNVCCATLGDGGGSLSCQTSCADGGGQIQCDGPAQCSAATPLCCADLKIGAGQPPNCPFESITSQCRAQCTTQIAFACPGTDKVRLCRASADCTSDVQNSKCCEFNQGGQAARFCVNPQLSQFATQCF